MIDLQREAVTGKLVEIGDGFVHMEGGSRLRLLRQQLLHSGHMAVIDVGIGNDVHQLTGLQTGHPITPENYDEIMARMEVYLGEFEEHGTDNITVDLDE